MTKIAEALSAAGLSVWWDTAIEGGSAFAKDIARELDAADVVIVVWSATSVESAWVLDEAGAGRDRKRLVPVQIDATLPPLGFRQLQSVDLSGWRGRAGDPKLAALVATITQVAGSTAVAPPPPPTSASGGRLVPWLAAALLMIAALGAGWRFLGPGTGVAAKPIVAVLPFTDMSEAKGEAYFAEGMAEEILDTLAGDARLTVLGGNTALAIRDNRADPDFARDKLGVTRLLEGSVRGGGGADNVKVSVRLIDTANRSEIWSQRFERSGANVADVQAEVAQAVAAQLAGELGSSAPETARAKVAVPPAAYEKVLVARQLLKTGQSTSILRARALADEATALAPAYAAAFAVRSRAASLGVFYGGLDASSLAAARRDAETAIKLDPTLAEGHTAYGYLNLASADYSGTIAAYRRALALKPDDTVPRNGLGNSYLSVGNVNNAIAEFEKVVAVDPLWLSPVLNLIDSYATAGRLDAARDTARRFRVLSPSPADADSVDSVVAFVSGNYGKSLGFANAALARNPALSNMIISRMHSYLGLFAAKRITANEWTNAPSQFLPSQAYLGNWAELAALAQGNDANSMTKPQQMDALALAFSQLSRPADLEKAFDARFANVAAFAAPDANLSTTLALASAFDAVGRASDARALRDFVRASLTRSEANGTASSANVMSWAMLATAEGDRSGALTRLERGFAAAPMRVCSNGFAIWMGAYRPLAPLFAEPRFAAIKARCQDEINKQRNVAGFPPVVFK